jgi:hypothetical protein
LPLPTPCSCLSGAFLGCVASTGFRRRCFRAIRVLRGGGGAADQRCAGARGQSA